MMDDIHKEMSEQIKEAVLRLAKDDSSLYCIYCGSVNRPVMSLEEYFGFFNLHVQCGGTFEELIREAKFQNIK